MSVRAIFGPSSAGHGVSWQGRAFPFSTARGFVLADQRENFGPSPAEETPFLPSSSLQSYVPPARPAED